MTRPIVVMGPSGCGKSTLAAELARVLGRPFVEGDRLHPQANLDKMARGEPLTDLDRAPFLSAVGHAVAATPSPVASCSALKRAYRDALRLAAPTTFFVHPVLPRGALAERLAHRVGHFMPLSLLDSQLAALEPLEPDESGVTIEGFLALRRQVEIVVEALA